MRHCSRYLSVLVVLSFLAIPLSSVFAQEAVIMTVPEETIWWADGTTEYRLDLWGDNTRLNGDVTDGVQWDVIIPSELTGLVTVTRAEKRPLDDFFEGSSMFMESIDTSMENQFRLVDIGHGKSNQTGNLVSYWMTIDPGFDGETSFGFDHVKWADPDGREQPHREEHIPFTVVTPRVHLKTIPERDLWIADGQTEYRVDIWVDNTELVGENTDGIQFDLLIPIPLMPYMTATRAEWPDHEDFFDGHEMDFEYITTSLNNQIRQTKLDDPVSENAGYFATYYFTIDPGVSGEWTFEFIDVFVVDRLERQLWDQKHMPFTVISPQPGDFGTRGIVHSVEPIDG